MLSTDDVKLSLEMLQERVPGIPEASPAPMTVTVAQGSSCLLKTM